LDFKEKAQRTQDLGELQNWSLVAKLQNFDLNTVNEMTNVFTSTNGFSRSNDGSNTLIHRRRGMVLTNLSMIRSKHRIFCWYKQLYSSKDVYTKNILLLGEVLLKSFSKGKVTGFQFVRHTRRNCLFYLMGRILCYVTIASNHQVKDQ